ncbi:MAG: ABC transporter permease [Gammaproteobacteria bacterium]
MAPILRLAARSVLNRKTTALLTVMSIALSVTLLLGVERIRTEARVGFANTISATDLIVGARSSSVQLLLYSVFRIGEPTNNVSWDSYQAFATHPEVDWTIPISLGDSHRGYRVMGTDSNYFEHYRYSKDRGLVFAEGNALSELFDVVLGAEVAAALDYQLGESIVVSHGIGATSFSSHANAPFTVAGILKKTGTPVDRTVHITLQGVEAMHADWQQGAPIPGRHTPTDQLVTQQYEPDQITAFLVGLKSRIATFQVQRQINEYRGEALLAIIPGVALQQLWDLVSVVELALLAVSAFVVLTGLLGMLTAITTSLNERRREMAILRAVGAHPWHIFALLLSEAALLAILGVTVGLGLIYLLLWVAQPMIEHQFGVVVGISPPTLYDGLIAIIVVVLAVILAAAPAFRAYRNSLADGMTIKT